MKNRKKYRIDMQNKAETTRIKQQYVQKSLLL